uniref:Uncharacterized protein n=1 Tax=Lepeophtheirus salmonis TaxID=72036 RepID=A0A0K2TFF5_LEPSM
MRTLSRKIGLSDFLARKILSINFFTKCPKKMDKAKQEVERYLTDDFEGLEGISKIQYRTSQ